MRRNQKSRLMFQQHPAYEPRAKGLTCPFCTSWDARVYPRVLEFENHLETTHPDLTDAQMQEWLSPRGYTQWKARAASKG